jgi:hypothetical protein
VQGSPSRATGLVPPAKRISSIELEPQRPT